MWHDSVDSALQVLDISNELPQMETNFMQRDGLGMTP